MTCAFGVTREIIVVFDGNQDWATADVAKVASKSSDIFAGVLSGVHISHCLTGTFHHKPHTV